MGLARLGGRGLAAVAAVGLATAAGPVLAVTGGNDDPTAHSYVAMLVTPGAGAPHCSGVLVQSSTGAPAVLTAAHCLYHNGSRTGTSVRLTFAPHYTAAVPLTPGTFYVDPLYDPSRSSEHDLAVIVPSGRPSSPAATLAGVGRTSGYSGLVQTVGVGAPQVGTRRTATERVVGRVGSWLRLVPGDGNSCDGDSGGPDLIPATDVVVALTDLGDCSHDEDIRVDTVEAHALVDAAVQWPQHAPLVKVRLRRVGGGRQLLEARVSPLYATETATRQLWRGGRWTTVQSVAVRADGTFAFPVPAHGGRQRVRVVLPATSTHPAGASTEVLIAGRG